MFPKLERARSRESDRKSDQAEAIAGLCKTYNSTVTKLLYAFAGLKSADEADSKAAASISQALAKAERTSLMEQITTALSGGVEKVVRCEDVAVRGGVMRDLRARFAPPEKPTTCDVSVQAAAPREKRASSKIQRSVSIDASALSSAKSVPSPEASASDAAVLAQLRGEVSEKPPEVAAAALPPPITEGVRSRPGSGAAPSGPPGMYERQMEWARKKAAKIQENKVEKENKEAEVVAQQKARKSKLYAHVESAMRKEKRMEDDGRVAAAEEMAAAEAAQREAAEARARHEEQERARMQKIMQMAEAAAAEAESRMREADARAREAEARCEAAQRDAERQAAEHALALEIRDAFGETGLETWPMFPGKRVWRVADSSNFDGRVSQEFRVKDAESGEPGVSMLMGRLAGSKSSTEVQCILFEARRMSELECARWWEAQKHRFVRRNIVTR